MATVAHMLERLLGAIKYAATKEKSFAAVFGAAITLIFAGTVAYSVGEGWSVGDSFYFAVATLTTTGSADPKLILTSEAMKLFTSLFVLVGIGILVELARQLGVGFVKRQEDHTAARHARLEERRGRRHKGDPPEKSAE